MKEKRVTIWCPHKVSWVDGLVCLYDCPQMRVRRCPAYKEAYPQLEQLEIPAKILDKYGPPKRPQPCRPRRRKTEG